MSFEPMLEVLEVEARRDGTFFWGGPLISLPSLWITSTNALPTEAKFRECRIEGRELRFAGFAGSWGLVDTLAMLPDRCRDEEHVEIVTMEKKTGSCSPRGDFPRF